MKYFNDKEKDNLIIQDLHPENLQFRTKKIPSYDELTDIMSPSGAGFPSKLGN